MTRSLKKGPYVDERVLKKIVGKNPMQTGVIKTWSRACVISPEMVAFKFGVYNGREHLEVLVSEDMVGHRLGEFSPTRKFIKHGGKMQKDQESAAAAAGAPAPRPRSAPRIPKCKPSIGHTQTMGTAVHWAPRGPARMGGHRAARTRARRNRRRRCRATARDRRTPAVGRAGHHDRSAALPEGLAR